MTRRVLAALVLSAAAGPALAGGPVIVPPDPVVVAPPPEPVLDWTGLYAGGQLGFGRASIVESGDPDIDGDGYVAGLHLGYNQDFGSFVIGAELHYNAAEIEFDSGDPEDTITRLAHVKLRAGYDAGQTLYYVAAGIADAEAEGGASGSGGVYGAGIERLFSERISGGVEYLVYEFDDFYSGGINLEVQTLQARLSWHF
jgi:hypothetical protein